jgi:hypothetical protein
MKKPRYEKQSQKNLPAVEHAGKLDNSGCGFDGTVLLPRCKTETLVIIANTGGYFNFTLAESISTLTQH